MSKLEEKKQALEGMVVWDKYFKMVPLMEKGYVSPYE
jgi:hypothetical protein